MPISTGQYKIVNVRQQNLAFLPDSSDGTPVAANFRQDDPKERWNVIELSNGNYIIQSVGNSTSKNSPYSNGGSSVFAVAGNRAREGTTIVGRYSHQEWNIQESRVEGQYTIATTDTSLFWGLVDNQTTTPISLASSATDTRNAWLFQWVFPSAFYPGPFEMSAAESARQPFRLVF